MHPSKLSHIRFLLEAGMLWNQCLSINSFYPSFIFSILGPFWQVLWSSLCLAHAGSAISAASPALSCDRPGWLFCVPSFQCVLDHCSALELNYGALNFQLRGGKNNMLK